MLFTISENIEPLGKKVQEVFRGKLSETLPEGGGVEFGRSTTLQVGWKSTWCVKERAPGGPHCLPPSPSPEALWLGAGAVMEDSALPLPFNLSINCK